MKKDFTPYLPSVIPSLFQMATLNPEMSIQGVTTGGDLVDLLNEVKPDTEKGKAETTININTDETEEKDVAIQMLSVFVEELEEDYAVYVEPTLKIMLSLISYEANDSIRNSVAGSLPGLLNCIIKGHPDNRDLQVSMGRGLMDNLFKAMKSETETDTLVYQVQAMKDIIELVGAGFMT